MEPNNSHYQNVERSLSIFFRSYICPILLGYKELSFCAKCEKVIFEQNEIEKGKDEIDHNSIQCDQCMCWYHYKCQALQLKDVNTLGGNWYCNLCLKSQKATFNNPFQLIIAILQKPVYGFAVQISALVSV